MKRYRWLKAEWPLSMRNLAKRLRASSFDSNSVEGFVLDRVRDEHLEARFIEKVEYDDLITDPFGGEAVFHRVDYRQCEFRASSAWGTLELIDPPRGVQTLVSRLAQATEFELSVAPLVVDVLSWAARLQRTLNVDSSVDSVQLGSVELADGIVAKAIVKGAPDVLDAAMRLVDGKRHVVEKVQLRLKGARSQCITFANSGVARFDADPAEELLQSVRESLSSSTAVHR